MDYMHNSKKFCHRDIKIENILIDQNLNLKLTDFGFSCSRDIETCRDYVGTMTYMAPEIKRREKYCGTSTDVFSLGVVLFILVKGVFPFIEAKRDDKYFHHIYYGAFEDYWKHINAEELSDELKDLLLWIFAGEGHQRPTV